MPGLPRGSVTLLFTDIEGSTRLLQQLGERYHDVLVVCRQLLREIFQQPRERGSRLLAQRYRQRISAMAAGRTTRRWTAREVLSCPLPKASA